MEESAQQQAEQRVMDKLFPPEKKAEEVKPAAPEAPAETTADAAPTEAPATEAPAESEEYEFEFRHGKYRVPKELKELHEGYLRTEDYTKKTMVAADRQRQAELIIEQSNKSQHLQTALKPKYDAVQDNARLLKQYEAVDWNTWISNNPTEANKGMLQWQVLKEEKSRLEGDLNQAAQQGMRAIEEVRLKLVEENDKILTRDIKGWSADTRKEVNGWAEKTYGFSQDELSKVFDSRVAKMMRDAKQWHDLQSSKPQVVKTAAQAATLKPNATDNRNSKQVKDTELRKNIRSAKTDGERARAVEALLAHRL